MSAANLSKSEEQVFLKSLRDLRSLVRIGSALSGNKRDVDGFVQHSAKIHQLHDQLLTSIKGKGLNEIHQLRLIHLTAEVDYNYGNPESAAARLIEDPRVIQLLHLLEKASETGNLPRIFSDSDALHKKRIWVLMATAFYGCYVRGQAEEALVTLAKIEGIIKSWKAPGTKSRLFFFMAHCHRALRSFSKAEQYFLDSQFEARKRVKREVACSKPPEDKERERLFSIDCTARIMAGLGWTLIQQGRLSRARQILYSSITLFEAAGHESLRFSTRYLIAMTERRLYDPVEQREQWDRAMGELEICLADYIAARDRRGIRRCAQEVARSYIDFAEYKRSARALYSKKARAAIANLSTTADQHAGEQDKGVPERLRVHLLEARLALVEDNLSAARQALNSGRELVNSGLEQSANGKPGDGKAGLDNKSRSSFHHDHYEEGADFLLIEAMIAIKEGQSTQEVIRNIIGVEGSEKWARREEDPVLRSEAVLRLALSTAHFNDPVGIERYLGYWKAVSFTVENNYLHRLRRQVEGICPVLTLDIRNELKSWPVEKRTELIDYKLKEVRRGYYTELMRLWKGTKKSLAEELGLDPQTLREYLKDE